jgi:hypothetical protein
MTPPLHADQLAEVRRLIISRQAFLIVLLWLIVAAVPATALPRTSRRMCRR